MEAIVERCCGLDVHQASIVACLLVGRASEKPRGEVRTFGTMTRDILALRDWLASNGCTQVAMEGTGIYWRPVYQLLEDDFELVVGNAHHIKNVPGRKTDVKDAEWIADLLRHGLIRKSLILEKPLRDLRDLTRYRRSLVEARSAERNRLCKLLETANIKLSSVASDIFGVSGMRMLRALAEGKTSTVEMAEMAKGTLRKKIPQLQGALEGRVEAHHRQMLKMQLNRLERMEQDLVELEVEIDQRLAPYEAEIELLTTIERVDRVVAATVIAEIGADMSVFPTPRHLASWACICPGNSESAGRTKGRGRKIRPGNVHLKTALVEAAAGIARGKSTYLKEKFYRVKAKRGHGRATIAIAHKLLMFVYHVLKSRQPYQDLGAGYLDRRGEMQVTHNLVKRLERLGYSVSLTKQAA